MINKTNDWFAAQMNAPVGVTTSDFYANGITPDNTGLHDRDYYKNIPQVQEAFNKDGKFDETAYNQFYDSAIRSYNDFSNDKFIEDYVEKAARHKYDWFNLEAPIMNDSVYMLEASDKNRHSHGLSNIWHKGEASFSDREVAQANYVRDEEGNVLDWTPNEGGIFKNIFGPTLALAVWDSDGEHMENGTMVQHHKGELKLDEKGDPYTEILDNKEYYGRDIVKWSDVLTEEGSWWNKVDPFDSDGLEKGIGKTIAETAIKIAPYFIPGAGPWLGAISATKALATVVPTMLKGVAGIVSDNDKTVFGQAMTKWENVMQKFTDSTSDMGRGSFWSAENLGNIVSSSFGQLASQKVIGQIPRLLNPTTKNTELGKQLALSYMAVTSASDSYSAFREAGANDTVAGIGMLATMGAMYGLMNVEYFKDWLFKDTWLDEEIEFRKSFKEYLKHNSKELFGDIQPVIDPKSKLAKIQSTGIYQKFYKPIKDFTLNNIVNGKYLGGSVVVNRMLNEGIEETAEELTMDAVKALALGADALGFKVTEDPNAKLNFGFSAKDFLSRYSSAFIGGALGGAIFEGYNNWENFIMGTTNKISDINDIDERMVWYIRNGYTDRMLDSLKKAYDNDELPANRNLSAINFEDVDNLDPENDYAKRVYKQGSESDNQALALYNIIRTRINTMKNILDEHIILYSDKDTVRNAFHQKGVEKIEQAAKDAKMSVKELQEKYFYDEEIEALREAGLLNDVTADAQKLSMYIFNTGVRLRKAKSELELASDENKSAKSKAVQQLEEHMKGLKKQYEALMNGENAGKYIANAWYSINGPLVEGYLNKNGDGFTYFPQTNVRHFAKWKYNVNYDELSESHKEMITNEFNSTFVSGSDIDKLRNIREIHYALTGRFSKDIEKIKKTYKDYKVDPHYLNDSYLNIEMREQNLGLINMAIAALESKLEKEGSLNEEEQSQLELFKYQKDLVENEELLIRFESSLSEEGEKEIGKWRNSIELSDVERSRFRDSVRNYYSKIKADKVISPYEGVMLSMYLESESAPARSWDFTEVVSKVSESIVNIDESFIDFYLDTAVLGSKIKSFWEEISINPKNARNSYNNIVQYVKENSGTDAIDAEDIVNTLLGTNPNLFTEEVPSFEEMQATTVINVPELLDFIDEINAIRQDIRKSSVHEFLSELSFIVHGRELEPISILEKEVSDLEQSTNLSDYVIDDASLEELRAAKHVVQMAMSLIQTAADGTNAKINKYQKEQFATVELPQANLFIHDLAFIYSRISKLIELAENNEQSLIDEQQDIAINMLPKMIKSIVNPSIDDEDEKLVSSAIDEMFAAKKGEGFIKKLWKDHNLDNITKSNYKDFYKRYLEFASDLRSAYMEIVNNYGGNKGFGKMLASKISGINFKSTKFTSKSDEQVTAFDSLVYFMTLVGANTLEFESKFKTAAAKETKLLPYFAQEFSVHAAWARVHNPELFDGFIENFKLPGGSKYIEKMTSLSRFTIVDGSGGTGKSTGVAKFLWNILKDEGYDILVVSNDKDRANALKDTLGVGDAVVKTTSELTKSILGKDYKLSDFVKSDEDGHYILQDKDLSDATIKKAKPFADVNKKNKLLIIDEITLLDEMELQIISQYAKFSDDNVSVLGLGDSKQNAKKVVLKDQMKTSGIEDCLYIKTPSLTASLRKTCRGKKLNLNVIGTIVSALNDWREDHIDADDVELSKQAQSIIDIFAGEGFIQLTYSETDNGLFGEKFSEDPKSEIDKLISHLNDGEKLAILVDDAGHSTYSDIKTKYGDKVEVLNSAQIQGGQFKYVVVDKTFDSDPDNKRATLKDFYTAISRSTTGTIIGTKKSDIRKIFGNKIDAVERHDASALIVNPEDERYNKIAQKYRDWRSELFALIPETTTSESASENKTEESKKTEDGKQIKPSEPVSPSAKTSDTITYEEIKKKISQPRVEEGVTEEDIRKEYLNPENKNKHAEQYRVRESEKDRTTSIDPELFYQWVDTDEILTFMPQFGLDSNKESDINDFKLTLKVFSDIVMEGKSLDDLPQGVVENIKIKELLNSDEGFYEWVPNDSGSTLFYCFVSNSNKHVIPIAKSKHALKGIVNAKSFSRITNIIPISSKGRIQKRIKDVCGSKIPSWKTLGIFVGDKSGFSHVRNMGWGKAFIPLTTWGHWHETFGQNFFRVQDLGDGQRWAWQGYNEDPRLQGIAVGVQKSIDFSTFLELCKHVRTVKRRAGDKDNRQESANVLSHFFGVTVDPTQYSTSTNREEAAEKNASEIKNSEISLLWRTRVSSLITAMVRYFDGESDNIKSKFFERLINLAPENSSGDYKSGFTITLPAKSGGEDLDFFLENTKDGFDVFKYNSKTGKYESVGIKLNNFSKLQKDGYGLGIINLYELTKELIVKANVSSSDLLDVDGLVATDISSLSDDDLRLAADKLFENDAIRFGIKTRYINPQGESKYYVPNEAFIVGDLLEGDSPFDSHVISKLSNFIDNNSVFKHGLYCNVRSDKQVDDNKEWKYRTLDTEAEQENYVWDIIDVVLPLYHLDEPGDSSIGDWAKHLQQFGTQSVNTIDGIHESISFEKEDEWLIPIKNGERGTIDIKREVGTEWLSKYPELENSNGMYIERISIDGKKVEVLLNDFTIKEISLSTPIDTSDFNIKSIVNAIGSIVVDGKNYEIAIKDDKLKLIYQNSEYECSFGFSNGSTVEISTQIGKNTISTQVTIDKLPENLQSEVRAKIEEFGQLIGKVQELENTFYYFKKHNSYYVYDPDPDVNMYQPCFITKYDNEYYVYDQSGEMLHNVIPVEQLPGIIEIRPTLTDGSYLETSDNTLFTIVGKLRVPSIILKTIATNSSELPNNEFEITSIDLANKTITGSFGKLKLKDGFVIDDLKLNSSSIKLINTSDYDNFVENLQKNPTLKRVFGGSVPNIEADSIEDALIKINDALSMLKFDIGKWWVVDYKNNRVSVNSRRDSETLIGKELKLAGIENIVDVEIVSGREGWKYKEIVVTLSDDSKQMLELTKSRKTDKWNIKVKDVESESKDGILDTNQLTEALNAVKLVVFPDGTTINKEWINTLEAKIESLKSGKDVTGLYNKFASEFASYLTTQISDPNYQQTIQILSPLIQDIMKADTTKTCKV